MRMTAARRGVAVSLLLISAVPIAARQKNGTSPLFAADSARIDVALRGVDRVAPRYAADLKKLRQDSQPLFIIVPGILGSILYDTDPKKPFWGEKGILSGFHGDALEYRDTSARAAFMDNFDFLGEHDVYGKLRDHLKFYSFGAPRAHLEFAYDWRQDIRRSAADFDAFLRAHREDITGRDVVVIAHSMGGLVVRSWYYSHFAREPRSEDYSFLRPPLVLFLGTPHYGSPSALVALVGGYGSGAAFETVINYFTKDLNVVGTSFYSAYELLPFGASSVTFRDKAGNEHANVDLFHPDIWQRCNWGWRLRKRLKMPPEEFYGKYLPARLNIARTFVESMVAAGDDSSKNPSSVCFYSDDTPTPAAVRVVQTESGCEPSGDEREGGDGRVLAEYTPYETTPHAHVAVRHLAQTHMKLPKDTAFLQYIDDMRDDALTRAVLAANPSDAVYTAFRNAGSLLPVPLGFARITEPETQAILAFNRAVLNAGYPTPRTDAELAKLLYECARTAPDNSESALRLYALAIAFAPDTKWAAYGGNHLGHILVSSDRWQDALPYLEHTRAHIALIDSDAADLLPRFYNTLAVAYERTGKHNEALRHYTLAESREALKNRKNLCDALEKRHIPVNDDLCLSLHRAETDRGATGGR